MQKTILLLILTLTCCARAADAQVYIKVGEANIKRSLLALPPLNLIGSASLHPDHATIGREIYNTIYNDFDVSSYFHFVEPGAYLENTATTGLRPKPTDANGFQFTNWQPLGAEFLIRGGYSLNKNQVELEIYLYHVPRGQLIFGKKYSTQKDTARKMAHKFANEAIKALTGKDGIFLARLVASSDFANKPGERFKEIMVMDWDGKSPQAITRHRTISISPAWSWDNQHIAYTSFAQRSGGQTRNADLFLYNVKNGARRVLSAQTGINSGAAFIPGAQELLLTISKGGNPDIYRMKLSGEMVEKITDGPTGAMNVEPAASPDAKRLAFSSTRSGQPMIYVTQLSAAKRTFNRVVFAGWYNASPDWSPDGSRLVFAGYDQETKNFDVFIMNTDGTGLMRLTSGRKTSGKLSNNENPSFSPDGRHVLFISDRTGTSQIYLVNADGTGERRITMDRHNYWQPKWSRNFDD